MAHSRNKKTDEHGNALLNVCTGCGAYVDVGIRACPNCRTPITNKHAFLYRYEQHIIRSIGGVLAGGLVWLALYVALPSRIMAGGWAAALIGLVPLVGGVVGWMLGYQTDRYRIW